VLWVQTTGKLRLHPACQKLVVGSFWRINIRTNNVAMTMTETYSNPQTFGRRAAVLMVVAVLLASRIAAAEPAAGINKRGLAAEPPTGIRSVKVDGKYMVSYIEQIPGTDVSFEMIPVPGGEFSLGSPASETERAEDEGPQVRIKVEPFWIGKSEVTWGEYRAFMAMYDAFKKMQRLAATAGTASVTADDKDLKLIQAHAALRRVVHIRRRRPAEPARRYNYTVRRPAVYEVA
jgi:formylglycine-generating enzyme required for sulfatase activity